MAFAITPQPPIVDWLSELDASLERSEGFFAGQHVALDLAGLVRTAPKTDYRSRAVNGVDLAYLELVITAGIVDCEEPTAVRLAAQHIGEPRRAFKRRAIPPVTGERKGPEDEHQIVGANEGARIDAQAPTQSHEVLHGATQLRRTFGDAARLND